MSQLLTAILLTFTVMSYNVENLFHPTQDSLNPDTEFTINGSYRWSYTRYNHKLEHIAQVIANVDDSHPYLVGLNEVESAQCLSDLCRKMPHYPYRYVHQDSPDKRGIDVALLYDSIHCRILSAEFMRIPLDSEQTTRDVLYAQMVVDKSDTLHVFVCHLPSQLSGQQNSRWKREKVKQIVRQKVGAIIDSLPNAKIVVLGDMNTAPAEDMLPLHNLMLSIPSTEGTHKYQGIWTCLDQFYVSSALRERVEVTIFAAPWLQEEDVRYLGTRPKRTFIGFRYNKNGYSDHLPILLRIK